MKLWLQIPGLLFFSLLFQNILQGQCRELVWADEFNINGSPDPEVWSYDLGTGQNGWGNQEIQIYTDDHQNIRVEDGNLIINAIKENNGIWTSARLKSQGKKNFTYGKVQFRAKLPSGSGTWPALWMLGEDIITDSWPACGEIDVMEHVGKDPGRVHGSLHSPSSFGGTFNTGQVQIDDFNSAFHDYAVTWTEDDITFSVDGNNYYTYDPVVQNDATWPFNDDFFIIMNIAMGGLWGSDDQYETGGLQNGIEPGLALAEMEVDYVRVYQQIDEVILEGETFVPQFTSGLEYSVANLFGGDFTWTVPEGANIVSGQGTHTIMVDWGDNSGPVSVEIVGMCDTYNASLMVQNVGDPQGSSYILDDFEDMDHSVWTSEPGDGNAFTLTEANGELLVEYDVTAPGQNPRLKLTLPEPVDLSEYTKMKVKAKTDNSSGTVNMRIDLFDLAGTLTNEPPVFKLEPLVTTGEYFVYEHDFDGDWASNFPEVGAMVDPTQIAGLYLYIDYGLFGSPGSDEITFEIIEMVNPNEPSGLEGLLNASGFECFPNPVDNLLQIKIDPESALLHRNLVLRLYNLQGQPLEQKIMNTQTPNIQWNVNNYLTGTYFLMVQSGGDVALQKIIIQ